MPKFIGDKAGVHIHDEGKRSHIKNSVGNDRVNFSWDDEKQVEKAVAYAKAHFKDKSGYDECMKAFKKLGYT